jgi:hypothetical protein
MTDHSLQMRDTLYFLFQKKDFLLTDTVRKNKETEVYMFSCYIYLCYRFDSDSSVRTSEFTEDMDELFFWIDETENILTIFVTLEEDALEEQLEKLKVCLYSEVFLNDLGTNFYLSEIPWDQLLSF